MRDFFGYVIDPERGVRLFHWTHYMHISFAMLAMYLPLRYGKLIYQSAHEQRIRNVFFWWLIALEIIYHAHNWRAGTLSFPLHICSFAVIMCLALLKTNSQRIFEFVFFFGVLGGFMALFVPFSYGFPYTNIRFYHFIFIHMTIIMIPLYYYKAYGYRVTLRATYKTFIMVLLIMPVIYNINTLLSRLSATSSVNYWFVSDIPEHVSAIVGDNYLVYIAVLISVVYIASMILYRVSNRTDRRRENDAT